MVSLAVYTILVITHLILVCRVIDSVAPFSSCDKKQDSNADLTISRVLRLSGNSNLAPETQSEIDSRCKEDLKYMTVLTNYTKNCMSGIPRQIFGTFLFTIKRRQRMVCRSGKEGEKHRQRILKYSKCSNSIKPIVRNCYNELLDYLVGIENDKSENKIPYTCCTLNHMFDCVFNKMDTSKECTQDTIEHIRERVTLLKESPTADAFCGEYNESTDKCDKLVIPTRSPDQKRPKSFLFPAIKIMLTLANSGD